MMRILLILVFLLLILGSGDAQLSFYKSFGTEGNDYGYDIKLTQDNGYIITGATDGIGNGMLDAYVIKIDSTGTQEWSRYYGTNDSEIFNSSLLTDSTIIFTGYTNHIGGNYNVYQVCTQLNGIVKWENIDTINTWVFPESSEILSGGELLVGGKELNSENQFRGFIAKYDLSNGEKMSSLLFDSVTCIYDIKSIGNSDFLVCGDKLYGTDSTEFWTARLNSNFDVLWEFHFGDTLDDGARKITKLTGNEYIVTGYTNDTIITGVDNSFIKISDNGTLLATNVINFSAEEYGISVLSYADLNNFLLVLNTNSLGNGKMEGFVFDCSYNTYGNYNFTYQFGSSENEFITAADTTHDRGAILVGYTDNTAFGQYNILVHKVDSAMQLPSTMVEELDLSDYEVTDFRQINNPYPNPSLGSIIIPLGVNEYYSIYDLKGSQVVKGLNHGEIIDLNLKQGFYILKISGQSFKLIIK